MLVHETLAPLAFLALLASTTLAQGQATDSKPNPDPQAKEPDALALVARAEALHKDGKDEQASGILRQAAARLAVMPAGVMRTNLEKVINDLLAKADPVTTRRREAFQLAAAEFVKLSSSYKRRKWYRMALLALRDAERLDPTSAAEPLAQLRQKGASAFAWEEARRQQLSARPAAARKAEPKDRLSAFTGVNIAGWKVTPTLITSPMPNDEASDLVLTRRLKHGDGTVSIEVKRTNTKGEVGLLFGANSYEDYFIQAVHYHKEGDISLGVFYWCDGKLTELGQSDFFTLAGKAREDWLRYGLRIQGNKVTCFVGDKDRLTVECPRKPHGRIGVSVARASTGQVQFRKLHVVGPPEPKPREKTPTEKLMEKVAEAEQQMKSRKREAREGAVLALIEARRMSRALPKDTVGKTVRESIRQLMVKANRPHGNLEKTRRAAAEAILVAADGYSNNRWHKTARALLLDVHELDPEVARSALEANSKMLEPILAKERGLPPEKQHPDDNTVLVKWFKGGRQPWDEDKAWKVGDTGAAAPADRVGASLILANEALGEKAELSIEVKTTRKRCTAGVAFAVKSINSYYLVLWTHAPKKNQTAMQLYRNQGRDYKRLGPTKTFRFSPEAREQWMTLKLRYGDKKVSIQLGETPEVVVPVDNQYLAGKIGLYAYVDETRQQICFRNLVIKSK
ncbi:MAG: hypothetical protein ACYST0_01755 [Planctomycetota bacterium]|jgi:hypothetical protein